MRIADNGYESVKAGLRILINTKNGFDYGKYHKRLSIAEDKLTNQTFINEDEFITYKEKVLHMRDLVR